MRNGTFALITPTWFGVSGVVEVVKTMVFPTARRSLMMPWPARLNT